MADLFFLMAIMAVFMSALVGAMVLWTVIVKMRHPKWSWRRCARYTTLIQ